MPNRTSTLLLIILSCLSFKSYAQLDAPLYSPIWGTSGATRQDALISPPLHNDANWAVLPSEQTLYPDAAARNMNYNQRPRRYRDINGNPILTNAQGNIIYDINGNPAIDSTSSYQGGAVSGGMSADADGIMPPDDPVDVPIDGGLGILLAIGLVSLYSQTKNRKIMVAQKV